MNLVQCVIVAPIARDLRQEPAWERADVWRADGRATATLQAWFGADLDAVQVAAAGDAAITVYSDFASMPQALKVRIIDVVRSDVRAVAPANWVNPAWKTLFACGAGDFFMVRRNGNWASILKSEWNGATDSIPPAVRRAPVYFCGIADTLGDGSA
jgi:hypothetical protein